eukprot:CAMPEP_0119270264 /NCGR_PEP_ID=MMETSP1329-20130426/7334_1 /TAXON_ID=114041 /ORGANISM="Genus nov. species nov., Strain RCC1024" /LENGTH=322 /DNA_ID=CAMNT_0007270279 /DNA_START=107 /DNA_END=1072 /DNA_ORIENTATION=+
MGGPRRLALLALAINLSQTLVLSPRRTRRPTRVSVATIEVSAEAATAAPVDLSAAERARTTAELGISHGAALSTAGRAGGTAPEAVPFASFADFVLDADGAPVLLLDESRAEHSKNLLADARCSVLLTARGAASPAASARVTVVGAAAPVPADAPDRVALETLFGVHHPYADDLLSGEAPDGRFGLWRVQPDSVFFVGGFGVDAQWVPPGDYADARPDQVAKAAPGLCATLNLPKHASDRAAVAGVFCGAAGDVAVTAVDRLGLDVRVSGDDVAEYRVSFRAAARSVEDAKSEVNKLFQEAWEREQQIEYKGAYTDLPRVVR